MANGSKCGNGGCGKSPTQKEVLGYEALAEATMNKFVDIAVDTVKSLMPSYFRLGVPALSVFKKMFPSVTYTTHPQPSEYSYVTHALRMAVARGLLEREREPRGAGFRGGPWFYRLAGAGAAYAQIDTVALCEKTIKRQDALIRMQAGVIKTILARFSFEKSWFVRLFEKLTGFLVVRRGL